MRVRRKIEQPLQRCLHVVDEKAEEKVMVLLLYEKLPDFCYACGRVGNKMRLYEDDKTDKVNLNFGQWMRTQEGVARNPKLAQINEGRGIGLTERPQVKPSIQLSSSGILETKQLVLSASKNSSAVKDTCNERQADLILEKSAGCFTSFFFFWFSWDLLRRLGNAMQAISIPWIVEGDFNEIMFDSEKQGGAYRDRNTPAFHAYTSEHRKRNIIEGLENDNGIWITSHPDVANIVEWYFADLFSTANLRDEDVCGVLNCVEMTLSPDSRETILALFTRKDIEVALFGMHPTKAPDPDGLSGKFFHKFWPEIGDEVTRAALKILNNNGSLNDWNDSLVVLISKFSHPQMRDLSEFYRGFNGHASLSPFITAQREWDMDMLEMVFGAHFASMFNDVMITSEGRDICRWQIGPSKDYLVKYGYLVEISFYDVKEFTSEQSNLRRHHVPVHGRYEMCCKAWGTELHSKVWEPPPWGGYRLDVDAAVDF
ncbi:hypothetical protein C2S52_015256 [Perilla frutescens var. hirtella]|nr:hypothetical protein C2S52_015256 [Perilla frutescens var. hirtella]